MSRQGRRVRIAPCIYRDGSGISATVNVGALRREARFAAGTHLDTIRTWQDRTRAEIRTDRARYVRGSLTSDAERYLRLVAHLASFVERRSEVRAWTQRYGHLNRGRLTTRHVQEAIVAWRRDGKAPKTVNHRVATLRHLYRTLDGRAVITPCDEIAQLAVPKTPPVVVPPHHIRQVAEALQRQEQRGRLRDAKTRGRFMVLASTGKRPSELRRAAPADIDLERRVWNVRDGKGGWSPGVYLNTDMLAAWHVFITADAWGAFESNSFSRVLYNAGWPRSVRPYNMRHAVGIALSETGADLADVQAHMGHKHISTTRTHYVPVLGSRMQAISQAIDGRLGWNVERDRGTSK